MPGTIALSDCRRCRSRAANPQGIPSPYTTVIALPMLTIASHSELDRVHSIHGATQR